MLKPFLFSAVALILSSCATSPSLRYAGALNQPNELWASATPPEVRAAARRFSDHERLPNGLIYGDSVRNLDLTGKTPATLEVQMRARQCREIQTVLRDPRTNEPALCQAKPVPQVIYDCPDGGTVRLKPAGDPCGKYRPQPHGVKAVRFSPKQTADSFASEAFKVDKDDYPIPKVPAHLNPALDTNIWADDAHADLAPLNE
ncbi:MAG: hypothetical protein EOP11_11250 [Proteobacteria bacterium]|nr:MAG: hypothetical protein EOP11_11250 [Pseudomonadota bacterium]